MMIFGPLVCATTSPETVTSASASILAVTDGPSTRSTAGRVTAAPGSPSSFSISMTSPSATLYCLPPVLTIAYIVNAPSCLLWSRCCPVSVDYCSLLVVRSRHALPLERLLGARRRARPWVTPGASVVGVGGVPDDHPANNRGDRSACIRHVSAELANQGTAKPAAQQRADRQQYAATAGWVNQATR